MGKLQLYIAITYKGFRQMLDINPDEHVKTTVRDLSDVMQKINYNPDRKSIFFMLKYVEEGVFITALRTIPGNKPDHLAAWLFIPYDLKISTSEIETALQAVIKAISNSKITQEDYAELCRVFDRDYETYPMAGAIAPGRGTMVAHRFYGEVTGYILSDLIGNKRYQTSYLPYPEVILADKAFAKEISGPDLTNETLDQMVKLLPPESPHPSYKPMIYGCLFNRPFLVPLMGSVVIEWTDGTSPAVKQPVMVTRPNLKPEPIPLSQLPLDHYPQTNVTPRQEQHHEPVLPKPLQRPEINQPKPFEQLPEPEEIYELPAAEYTQPVYQQPQPEYPQQPVYPQTQPEYPQQPAYQQPQPEYPQQPAYQQPQPEHPQQPVYQQPQPEYPQQPAYQQPQTEYPQQPAYQQPQPEYPQQPAYQQPQPEYPQQPVYQQPQPEYPQQPAYQQPQLEYPQQPVYQQPQPEYPQQSVYQQPQTEYPQQSVYQQPQQAVAQQPSFPQPQQAVAQQSSFPQPQQAVGQEPTFPQPQQVVAQGPAFPLPQTATAQPTTFPQPQQVVAQQPSFTQPQQAVAQEPTYQQPQPAVAQQQAYQQPQQAVEQQPAYPQPQPVVAQPPINEPIPQIPTQGAEVAPQPLYPESATNLYTDSTPNYTPPEPMPWSAQAKESTIGTGTTNDSNKKSASSKRRKASSFLSLFKKKKKNQDDENDLYDGIFGVDITTKIVWAAIGCVIGILVSYIFISSFSDSSENAEKVFDLSKETQVHSSHDQESDIMTEFLGTAESESTRNADNSDIKKAATAQNASIDDAVNYLDSHHTWVKEELESYTELRGLYDDMNTFNKERLVTYWGPKLSDSKVFKKLVSHATQAIKRNKAPRLAPDQKTYNPPTREKILVQSYLNTIDP